MTFRPSFWSRRASLAAVVVLPVPFTPTMQNDGRSVDRPRQLTGMLGAVQQAGETLLQSPLEVGLGLERAFADLVLERLGELDRGGDPEIRLDQNALHLLQIVGVEPAHEGAHVGQRDPLDAGPEPVLPLAQSAVGHAES